MSVSTPEGLHWDPDNARLRYEFWEAQREALSAFRSGEPDITAFLGGYGSGKTITGARLLITLALEVPGSKSLALGIDHQKAKETTYETLFEQLPGERTHIFTSNWNGPENSPIIADYNRQDKRLTFANDSVIRLGSADNPQSAIGDEFIAAWLDEPSKYHPNEKLYTIGLDVIPSRLRDHSPQYGQFWTLTGNGYNAAYKILRERENQDGEEIGHQIQVVTGSVLNNPYISEGVKERYQRQYSGSALAEQALHGGFEAEEGLVYNLRREEHIHPLDIYQDRGEDPGQYSEEIAIDIDGKITPLDPQYRVFGYDQGWHPDPRAFVEIGRTVDDRLVVVDEFKKTRSHLDEGIRWLKERPEGVVSCEHEPEDIEDMQDAGIPAIKANKSLQPGLSEVSDWLNPTDGETGEPLPPRLLIASRCEGLINEFFSYKQEDIGASSAEDHLLDALRYAIMAIKEGEDTVRRMGFGSIEL